MTSRLPLGGYPSDTGSAIWNTRKIKKFQSGKTQFFTIPLRVHRGKVDGIDVRPDTLGRCVTIPKGSLCLNLSTPVPTAFLKVVSTEKTMGSNKVVKINLADIANGGKFYLLEQTTAFNMTTERIKCSVRVAAVPAVIARVGTAIANADSLSEFFSHFFKSIPGQYELIMLVSTMIALLPESRCKVGIQSPDMPSHNFLVFDVHEVGYHLMNLMLMGKFDK